MNDLILGIETSCDDTAAAVLDTEGRVLSSVVSSQMAAHRPYGGVVPEIASREHLKNWPPVIEQALEEAECDWDDLGAVAATSGPGLVGALLVGLSLARAVALARGLPFFSVHHLEGHLYSPFLDAESGAARRVPDAFVGLVVSGGHTVLYRVEDWRVETLAATRDDAFGEAFDKVGNRLGFDYPQGPYVDRVAEEGDPDRFDFTLPRFSQPWPHKRPEADPAGESLNFSYSGLKTQAIQHWLRLQQSGSTDPRDVADLAAGFRQAAVAQIMERVQRLHDRRPIEHLAVSGGAAANRLLRRELEDWASQVGVDLSLVPLDYSGDNAAMIAHTALLRARRGESDDPLEAEAASRVSLGGVV